MSPVRLLVLVAAGLLPTAGQAAIFKCQQRGGKVYYTDRPCPPGSQGGQLPITEVFEHEGSPADDSEPVAAPAARTPGEQTPPPERNACNTAMIDFQHAVQSGAGSQTVAAALEAVQAICAGGGENAASETAGDEAPTSPAKTRQTDPYAGFPEGFRKTFGGYIAPNGDYCAEAEGGVQCPGGFLSAPP